MTYAAMTFFILAILTGLFGFASFESGGEPGAAAMARLLAAIFAVGFAVTSVALVIRRMRANDGPNARQSGAAGTVAFAGGAGSASERGSWDGSCRSAAPRQPSGTAARPDS